MATEVLNDLITPGVRGTTRGDEWTVRSVTPYTDCAALRLHGCGRSNAGTTRTLLAPFDRLKPCASRSAVTVVSRRGWLRHVSSLLRAAEPFGSLATAATAKIRLLPFQLEPAVAMLRHARLQLLIADEVGLGKTIQTGVILGQLSANIDTFRALILTPAGLRQQWRQELHHRFALEATVADAGWLAAQTRDLPPDVSPWTLPGIYIASLDLVKRPEVLRSLEDVSWDIAVVDEVHGAGLGTARLAAAEAVARTARRVVLLTATPPDGEPLHFDAITRLGTAGASGPVTQFRRSRTDAGVTTRRKSILLAVHLSPTERHLHRLLHRYTRLVWSEALTRNDARARLAAVILRKRALSSAASLLLTVRRRLLLLGSTARAEEQQLLLPLRDEEPLDDELSDSVIGASGLSDVVLERSCLGEIAAVAERATHAESKLKLLGRLLSRTAEPVIIFTEYRDTLAQLAGMISHRRPVLLLHGGMTPGERAGVQRAFNESGAVLLATDAASEGLNLHERCRLVLHFELPWTPSRLEQRTGRVDRLGQSRRVHEIMLVARHTCERLVLAPLLKRARMAARRGGAVARMTSLTESAVAAAVMAGVDVIENEDVPIPAPAVASMNLRAEAQATVRDLASARRLASASGTRRLRAPDGVVVTGSRRRACSSILVVVQVELARSDGRPIHRELVPLAVECTTIQTPRRSAALARVAQALMASQSAHMCGLAEQSCGSRLGLVATAYREAARTAAVREREIASAKPSAARRLVQVSLFDARETKVLNARRIATAQALLETDERLSDLSALSLRTTSRVVAVRFGWELLA